MFNAPPPKCFALLALLVIALPVSPCRAQAGATPVLLPAWKGTPQGRVRPPTISNESPAHSLALRLPGPGRAAVDSQGCKPLVEWQTNHRALEGRRAFRARL